MYTEPNHEKPNHKTIRRKNKQLKANRTKSTILNKNKIAIKHLVNEMNGIKRKVNALEQTIKFTPRQNIKNTVKLQALKNVYQEREKHLNRHIAIRNNRKKNHKRL